MIKYLTNPSGNSFVFEPCDPSEVNILINQLNPSKSSMMESHMTLRGQFHEDMQTLLMISQQ